jgi:oxalate decarboxylase/phosphoglucose isomerase-like protein (cupin superfamily)
MNKKKSISAVIKTLSRSNDSRGYIKSICDMPIQNVSIIKCNKNTIRSNHYHFKDYHIMHILEGEVYYFYKKINEKKLKFIKVKKGENIFTPPKEFHATYFPKKTILIVSSKNPRDQKTYEKDTVRIELITKRNIKSILKQNEKS